MEPDREQWYQQRIAELEQQIAKLTEQVAKLSKNSSNSSKPPSSDIVKPPRPPQPHNTAKPHRRKIGGQPGHPKHERQPFPPDQVGRVRQYTLDACPCCGGQLCRLAKPDRIIQQAELRECPIDVTEHRGLRYRCRRCGREHTAPLPRPVVKAGTAGPRLTALTAYLKGLCHASYSTLQRFFRDILKMAISRGALTKLIRKASAALAASYEELRRQLPAEKRINVDETGHPENGKRHWTWCFRASNYTLFRIDRSRGSQVLIDLLGREFAGTLGCDYFSAYRKYMTDLGVDVQFCLAHLIRDVKFLTTLPDAVTRNYGRRLLQALRRLFRVIHRRDQMSGTRFQRQLERARQHALETGRRAPPRVSARNLAERFRRHGDAYFRFVTTPGIEPTNNLAEQAMRFVVIDRRITQGTRGPQGQRWCERIWSAIATCAQQGRSVHAYLQQAIAAHFASLPTPSLIPQKA